LLFVEKWVLGLRQYLQLGTLQYEKNGIKIFLGGQQRNGNLVKNVAPLVKNRQIHCSHDPSLLL